MVRLKLLAAAFAVVSCSGLASAQVQAGWQAVRNYTIPAGVRFDAAGGVWTLDLEPRGVQPASAVVRRYTSSGTLSWSSTPTPVTSTTDFASAFAVDPAGQFATFAQRDFFGSLIVRVDGNGVPVWQNSTWGLNNVAYQYMVRELPTDGAGNTFVVCATSGGATSVDPVVLSFASDGSLNWSKRFDAGSSLVDVPADACADRAGGVYVVGAWNAPGLATLEQGQMGLSRVDSNGNVSWTRTVSGAGGGGRALCVATDSAGNALVGGTSASRTEAWLFKYDPAGNQLWTRSYSIGIAESYQDLRVDAAGSVYVTGVESLGTGAGDTLTAKYDAAGTLQWRHVWSSGAGGDDSAQRIEVDVAGRATVFGLRSSAGQSVFALRYERDGTPRWRTEQSLLISSVFTSAAVDADGRAVFTSYASQGPVWIPNAWIQELRDQSVAFCFGDGSSGACPCGNTSPSGASAGCANSAGTGARVEDLGVASVSVDTLSLRVRGTTPSGTCVVVQASASVAPVAFGDGYRCVGGQLRRLFVRNASGGALQVPGVGDPTLSQRSAAEGDVLQAGSTRTYQVFYRDSDPLYCPSPSGNTFNMSNGLRATWAP